MNHTNETNLSVMSHSLRSAASFRWLAGISSAILLVGLIALPTVTTQAADEDAFQLEDGFTLLFNGHDLTGWKLRGGESLDGKTQAPKKRFQVHAGLLIIDGKTKGNMVIDSEHEFSGDVHIKFEYRPDAKCNNDLYFRGLKFDLKKGNVKNIHAGVWNELEIIVQDGQVEFKNDGKTQRVEKAKSASSPLGIRAEFGAIEIRRMRYK